jgi:hypothetical protein
MECLINHQTKKQGKRHLRRALNTSTWRVPSRPFEVPVLTSTNRNRTFFEEVYGGNPLVYVDKRHPKWTWWEKLYSIEENVGKFMADGHEFFMYADADDAMLWQAPTVARCKEALGNTTMLFQESNHGFPRPKIFKRRAVFNDKGPCAGAFIARTAVMRDYCRMIRDLSAHESPWVTSDNSYEKGRSFDDQGAWFTLSCLLPTEIRVDNQYKYLTNKEEPDFDEVL